GPRNCLGSGQIFAGQRASTSSEQPPLEHPVCIAEPTRVALGDRFLGGVASGTHGNRVVTRWPGIFTIGRLPMKKFALTIAAAITLAAANADAADLRMPVKAPPPVAAAVWSWTGFYIGVNGGYSWGRSRNDASFITTATGAVIVPPAGSVLGGGF